MKYNSLIRLLLGLAVGAGLSGLAQAADIEVTVEGIAENKGDVLVALLTQAEFPNGRKYAGQFIKAAADKMHFVFKDVPVGKYAISAYHDLDGNGRLNANMLGLPNEPYGFSRQARGTFGAPDFAEAAFSIGQEHIRQTVVVK